MPKVLACYKWVVDEADIKINTDRSIDLTQAKWKISDYDKNAIEAAVQSAQALGCKSAGLIFATDRAKPSIKDALSRGLDKSYWVKSELATGADGFVTAKALAAAVKKIENVKFVICAEGASDTYARQIPPRLGSELDWPVITSVKKISISGNMLTAHRQMDDCIQIIEVELPAVVAVLPEINEAPLPSLKAVIAASKKPVIELNHEDLGIADVKAKTQVNEQKAYIMVRKNIVFNEGNALDKVKELVTNLKKEGVL